jgi:hypothetical protein
MMHQTFSRPVGLRSVGVYPGDKDRIFEGDSDVPGDKILKDTCWDSQVIPIPSLFLTIIWKPYYFIFYPTK